MKTTFSVILIPFVLAGCQFSKSVKKDFASGITTTGNNLTCEDIYLTVNDEKITRNSFIYGETFYTNFSDIKGFTKEKENVFPGMEMIVINQAGDTVFQNNDIYLGSTGGVNYSPLLLTADLTLAAPIKSKGDYTLLINIWDKKGNGTFTSKFDFKVKENKQIAVESSNVSFDEVYLFSQSNYKVITDNKIKYNDNIHIIIEGLKGFKEEDGLVFPGLSIKATDAADNTVLESDDLFLDYSTTGIATSDLAARVSAHFNITGTQFNNPLHCEMTVWDKKSDARIKATTNMTLE